MPSNVELIGGKEIGKAAINTSSQVKKEGARRCKEKQSKKDEERSRRRKRGEGGAPSPETTLRRPPSPPVGSLECLRHHLPENPRRRSPPSPENAQKQTHRSCETPSSSQLWALRPTSRGRRRPHHHLHQVVLITGSKPQQRATTEKPRRRRKITQNTVAGAAKQQQAATFRASVRPAKVARDHTTDSTRSPSSPGTIPGQFPPQIDSTVAGKQR